MFVGSKLKSIRKIKKVTIKQLAGYSGLSTGFLSNLERDSTSPTLEQLQQICLALGVSMVHLLESAQDDKIVVRENERIKIFDNAANVSYESLTHGYKRLAGACIKLGANAGFSKDNTWCHSYDEVGTVIRGEMIFTLDGVEYHLKEGDTLYISAFTQHTYYNPGKIECISYWVFQDTPDNYIRQNRV